MRRDQKGQIGPSVGGLIALLILIAIGAMVLYSVTKAVGTHSEYKATVSPTGENSVDLNNESPKTAVVDTSYDFTDTVFLTITYNDTVIENSSLTGSGSFENDVLSLTAKTTNTLNVAVDNSERVTSLTSTLTATTYVGSAVSNVEEKGSTVINLLTILAIVVVAALIIGVVMHAIGGVGGAGMPGAPALFRR